MIKEKIYEAKDGKKVNSLSASEITKLIKWLTATLGCPIHSDNEELGFFRDSLKKTHGYWSVKEIVLAVELMQQGALNCEIEAYRPVNSQSIAKLMNAYRVTKTEILTKYGRNLPEEQIPEEQKEMILIEGIRRIYAEWLKNEDYLLTRMFVYYPYLNTLKKYNRISISESDEIEARKYSESVAPKMRLEQTIVSRVIKPDQDDITKYMELYYLSAYFQRCKLLNIKPI